MNLSCNVSPTPASLSLCWYRAPVDLDTAFHFSNSYVILWYSLRKYNTTQNLPGVTPPAAVPAFSTETGEKGNLLKCGNYAYANSFTTLKQEENRKPSPQMLAAQVSLLLFVNNKYKLERSVQILSHAGVSILKHLKWRQLGFFLVLGYISVGLPSISVSSE